MLHALLIPGTLTFLSVTSNRRLKAPAFRFIGAFMIKARDARDTDLAWAHVFVGKFSPVSRPFTELAGQTLDRVHRECASPSSRIWLNVPPIGRLLSQAASAGGVRCVSELTFLLEVLPTGYSTRCADVVPPKHISKAQSHHLRGRCCNCTDDPGLPRRRFRWYNARVIRAVHTAHVPSSDFAVIIA